MSNDQPNTTPDLNNLVSRLQRSGYKFSSFELSCEDPCDPIDVEWNYKDMVHVSFVHSHMSREFTFIGENSYTTLDLQRVLGLDIPQSTSFYTTEDNALIAHTSLFLFIVIVEVRFESVGELLTRTTTRYSLGSKTPLIRLLSPILRFALKRNWRRFTADDRPLRQRRGLLRSKGFQFDETRPVNIRETLNISKNHVIAPKSEHQEISNHFKISEFAGKTVHIGDSDHFGLQVCFKDNQILIFPRLCPHMGSSLDQDSCDGHAIPCPWHGRKFKALCSIKTDGQSKTFIGPLHICVYDGAAIHITTLSDPAPISDSAANSGYWTEPWRPAAQNDTDADELTGIAQQID